MKIVVLGSGTSHGVPVVGCDCRVCTSDDIRDKRMRSSIYIEGSDGDAALIDAGPEFRLQALRAGIKHLDAIFLTHSHADHLHGLDDVRPLSHERPIPVYGNEETITAMKARFSYAFKSAEGPFQRGGGKPRLAPVIIDGPVKAGNLRFTPVPVKHGLLDILGWEVEENAPRLGKGGSGESFLYLTDTSAIPDTTLARLGRRKRLIIIGGLRQRPHETHFTFEEALNTALDLSAETGAVYLTHICHDYLHGEIEDFCRAFRARRTNEEKGKTGKIEIHPARDGLELNL